MYQNYTKLVGALVLICIFSWIWQSYDYIIIPIDNMQMSPSYNEKEFYIGSRIDTPDELRHGDVVYYSFPHSKTKERGEIFLARIIGLPGDKVEWQQGEIYLNGEKLDETYVSSEGRSNENLAALIVPRGHVYLVVDNRKGAGKIYYRDSRHWGPLLMQSIEGVISD